MPRIREGGHDRRAWTGTPQIYPRVTADRLTDPGKSAPTIIANRVCTVSMGAAGFLTHTLRGQSLSDWHRAPMAMQPPSAAIALARMTKCQSVRIVPISEPSRLLTHPEIPSGPWTDVALIQANWIIFAADAPIIIRESGSVISMNFLRYPPPQATTPAPLAPSAPVSSAASSCRRGSPASPPR